ncbi:hypothetical protein N9O69_05175 [Alphaproteobacteria bacterium]|nr:hypothetical protein [Alphaproteobacteria bacterium]
MNKRIILKGASILFLTLALSAFKLPSLGGGGGGGADWKTIAGDFNGGFAKIADGLKSVVKGIQESKAAISLKTAASTQADEDINKVLGTGKTGSAEAEAMTSYAQTESVALSKALEGKQLDAETKQKLAMAGKKYMQGAIQAVPGYVTVIVTFNKAKDAGTPKPMDLVGAASDIPNIMKNAPSMITIIPTAFNAIKAYRKSLEKAEVPMAEIQNSDFKIDTN